jgi:predicted naringenin-chalcone synthase
MGHLFPLCFGVLAKVDRLPRPVEQVDAKLILDMLDAARKGRRREVAPLRRLDEGTRFGDREDVFKPFQTHAAPNLQVGQVVS